MISFDMIFICSRLHMIMFSCVNRLHMLIACVNRLHMLIACVNRLHMFDYRICGFGFFHGFSILISSVGFLIIPFYVMHFSVFVAIPFILKMR
jgi:hypothetical protein